MAIITIISDRPGQVLIPCVALHEPLTCSDRSLMHETSLVLSIIMTPLWR